MTARVNPLVGFRLLSAVCVNRTRKPTVCYHPGNPGTRGGGLGAVNAPRAGVPSGCY
jgi:hypothetical protein